MHILGDGHIDPRLDGAPRWRPSYMLARQINRVALSAVQRHIRMVNAPYDATVHDARGASLDYVRYATLALAINRLSVDRLDGPIAEVGTYRGRTARFMRDVAENREIYAFDTFEGVEMPTPERCRTRKSPSRLFSNTNISVVRQNLGHNVRLVPGVFPRDAPSDLPQMFALADIDLDFEASTQAALEYLYPLIRPGGYLFVHDYNNHEFKDGVRLAVDDFFLRQHESFVEIPDRQGSVIIRKRWCSAP